MTKEEILAMLFKCETVEQITEIDDAISEISKTDTETAQLLWRELFMVEEGIIRDDANLSGMKNFNLKKFKHYVDTYDSQLGHKNYEVKTIIDDFLYGIGLSLNEDEYKNHDGYQKFQEVLLEHLNGKARRVVLPIVDTRKVRKLNEGVERTTCHCGQPINMSNTDCLEFKLCKDHASDA